MIKIGSLECQNAWFVQKGKNFMHWSIIPIPRDNKLCQFCSYYVIENEAHFVLEYLFYNSIRNIFPSQFSLSKVALDSESFFRLDINLILISISPLRYSREFML